MQVNIKVFHKLILSFLCPVYYSTNYTTELQAFFIYSNTHVLYSATHIQYGGQLQYFLIYSSQLIYFFKFAILVLMQKSMNYD